MMRDRRLIRLGTNTAAIGIALAFVVFSPLLLIALAGAITVDWTHLSEIGETYGLASALLSALALLAVAYSILFQARQTRLSQVHAFRAMHTEILRMAFEEPNVFLPTLGAQTEEEIVRYKRHVFTTLRARYWLAGYELGQFGEWTISNELIPNLFGNEFGKAWWRVVRPYWLRDVDISDSQRRFAKLLDDAFDRMEFEDDGAGMTQGDCGPEQMPTHVVSEAEPANPA